DRDCPSWVCFVFSLPEHKVITADSGQDVTVPCQAPNDNNNLIVVWGRADLKSEYVLLYQHELIVPDNQHPSFVNRTDLQDRQMKDGDVSLILKSVNTDDTGMYECYVIRGFRKRTILIVELNTEDGSVGPILRLLVPVVVLLLVILKLFKRCVKLWKL
uniref:Ig-like domain-containing protein n=1 Tax=Oreochromis niloticus TaxID=8128 RepID=I3KJI5_ORENI